MDEDLDLDAAALGDGTDLIERELAREDDADEAEFLQGEDAFEVVGHELRGGVEREGGKVLPHKPGDAEILHDESVGAKLVENGELLDGGGQLLVFDERVEGDVDLLAAQRARVGEQLAELVGREVHGLGTSGEGVKAKVDGIRARREGGAGNLE